MNDNKSGKMLLFAGAVLTLMMAAAVSYAYFTLRIDAGDVSLTKGTVLSDNVDISLIEDTEGVVLEDTYPMNDEMALKTVSPYTFTVSNNEDGTVRVKVVLEVVETSTLDDSLVNVSLDNTVISLSDIGDIDPSERGYKSAYELSTFTLTSGGSKKINLRAWVNIKGTLENAQNKTWSSRVLLVPERI